MKTLAPSPHRVTRKPTSDSPAPSELQAVVSEAPALLKARRNSDDLGKCVTGMAESSMPYNRGRS